MRCFKPKLMPNFFSIESIPSYFADWSAISKERLFGADEEPTCVPIPRNLSLCHGIGYNKVSKVTARSDQCCMLKCSSERVLYRVTHHVVQNLPLTSKPKFLFGLARPKQNFCFDVNVV